MKTHARTALVFTILVGLGVSSAPAQDAAKAQSSKLAVLNLFIGDWASEGVNETADGERTVTTNERSMSWAVGKTYVEDRVGGDDSPSFFGMWTYDTDAETYRAWYFGPNSNKPIILTVKWDEAAATLTGAGYADTDGSVLSTTHKFVDQDKYVLTGTLRTKNGELISAFTETNTRK